MINKNKFYIIINYYFLNPLLYSDNYVYNEKIYIMLNQMNLTLALMITKLK